MFSKRPVGTRALSIALLSLLALSFVLVMAPARATNGVVQSTQHGKSTGTSDKLQLTTVLAGDLVVVGATTLTAAASYSDVTNIVSVNQVPSGNFVFGDFTPYSTRVLVNNCIDSSTGVSCMAKLFIATAKTSGLMNITVTYAATTFHESFAYDLRGYTLSGIPIGYGAAAQSCANQCTTALSPALPIPGIGAIVIGALAGNGIASEAAGDGGWTTLTNGTNYWGQSQYIGTTIDTPNTVPFSRMGCSGGPCSYVEAAIALQPASATASTTSTTTATPSIFIGSVGGITYNGSVSTNLATHTQYFTYVQNTLPQDGIISNMTIHIKKVSINASTTNLVLTVFKIDTPGQPPSGTFPLQAVIVKNFQLTNNTGPFMVGIATANIGGQFVCGGCYWGIGLYTKAGHSNSVSVTDSGVSLYVSNNSTQWYEFGAPVSQISVYNGFTTPPLSAFGLLTFGITVVTTTTNLTTTVTTTCSGCSTTVSTVFTATTSVTSTLTSTTLDMNLAVQSGADYGILAMVILLPAFALMVPIAVYTKSAMGAGIGFVAGMMIGSALGVQAALVPPVFLGITVVIGIFVIVGLSRGGGGP